MAFGRWADIATAKNRVESQQLEKQLDNLEKQQRKEMIILDNKKKYYKKRYMDMIMKGYDFQYDLIESLALKNQKVSNSNIVIDYDTMHDLVFSNNAVDIENILILHLVSVHKTETLTPAPARNALAAVIRANDQTAMLIEKSQKTSFIEEIIMDLIPFYTIEISESSPEQNRHCFRINKDNKLANRVLFNGNLRKLIITVISVLYKSNFSKFKKLIQLAQDPESIKQMLMQPKSQKFIEAITAQVLVTSPENFNLTPPFKLKTRNLNVTTCSGSLENLVRNLRSSVLQIPVSTSRIQPIGSKVDFEEKDTPASQGNPFRVNNLMAISDDKYTKAITIKVSKLDAEYGVENTERRSSLRSSAPNFIQKNIQEAAKTKKIEHDTDDEVKLPARRESRRITRNGAVAFRERRESDAYNNAWRERRASLAKEVPSIEEHVEETAYATAILKNVIHSPRPSIEDHSLTQTPLTRTQQDRRESLGKKEVCRHEFHLHPIKQNTCPACLQRWKEPLPSPKSPRVSETKDYLKTDSKQILGKLIDQEKFDLESYNRKYGVRTSAPKRKSEPVELENLKINPIDLARIEHEIRQKETDVKIDKFMKNII